MIFKSLTNVATIPVFNTKKYPPILPHRRVFKIKMVAGIGLEPMTKGL